MADDIVISDKAEVIYVEHVSQFIQQHKDRKIALNKDKWKYFQSKVTFAGCLLSPEVYQVDTSITEATSKLPTPASHTELHSYCDLLNQLTSGTYIIVELMSPLRPLLSIKNEFIRSTDHALLSKVKSS